MNRTLAAVAAVLAGLTALFLALPLVGLLVQGSGAGAVAALARPKVLDALRLSVVTSSAATALVIVGGTPLAYILQRYRFVGREALLTLVNMPAVLPPVVSGLALLFAFGRRGLLGRELTAFGISIPFTPLAVVLAQAFVASPLFINAAHAGFAAVDRRYLQAAAALRAGPGYRFWRVSLPMAAPSLIGGAALTWARALGEFGATIMFAGNLPGVTQTVPLAIYLEVQTDPPAAVALALLLAFVSFLCLLLFRTVTGAAWPRR
ncbi:MAG TPA: ABC transporter permease [Limnochordia bacterium]